MSKDIKTWQERAASKYAAISIAPITDGAKMECMAEEAADLRARIAELEAEVETVKRKTADPLLASLAVRDGWIEELRAKLEAAAPSAAQAAGVDMDEQLHQFRTALEIIGVGDAPDPRRTAAETLVQTGFWKPEALATTPSEGVAFIPLCARCAETGECRPLGARGCEGVAAPVEDEIPLKARIFKRESTSEWVLELEGTANGTFFINRHTEPLSTPLEDVAGLPSLYAQPSAEQVASEAAVRDEALEEAAQEVETNSQDWDRYDHARSIRDLKRTTASGEKGDTNA